MNKKGRELLVGAYISRTDGNSVRVVRLADSHVYRGYVNGTMTVEGSRAEAMRLTR